MSSARYQQQLDENDSGSDEDLALDELDPIPADDAPSRHARSPFAGRYQSSGLGGKIRLNRLSPQRSYERSEEQNKADEEGSEHANGHSRYPTGSVSIEDDDAPLLPHSDGDSHQRDGSRRRRSSKSSRISSIVAKMRSTPRSQDEEDYDPTSERRVRVGCSQNIRYPPNLVSNAKYTPWSFIPRTLYHEFSFFLNLYFLLVALSQIIPELRIGYLSTYVAPLAFVLVITIGKEAADDITRRRRDAEANSEEYAVLALEDGSKTGRSRRRWTGRRRASSRLSDIEREEQTLDKQAGPAEISKMSSDLKVGDVLKLGRDQRVPADVVILHTLPNENVGESGDTGGEAFIRTDQLDGETDWKLRLAPALTQGLDSSDLKYLKIKASKPERKLNEFIGSLVHAKTSSDGNEEDLQSTPLTVDNTAWANTVVASSCSVLAVVVYTGPQTRQAMSTSASRTKTGLLEYEINSLTKILCFLTLLLSLLLVAVQKFETKDGMKWYVSVTRFLILFSTIVPISLRVNMDLGKSVYAWYIQHDQDIPETVVRSSTIPEDLGRIEYLLTDKTGTLTQNDMALKKIHVGTVSYAGDAMSEVNTYIRQGFGGGSIDPEGKSIAAAANTSSATRSRREIGSRVRDLLLALAVCHNVTPTRDEENGKTVTTYQASSPDEIAIVKWTEEVGLRLAHRDRHSMVLESIHSGQAVARVEILNLFPFTSDGKRMGVIVRFGAVDYGNTRDTSADPIWFFQKGADTVMTSIVAANDWLDEETANMAREGLRTLVVGRKRLQPHQYQDFVARYKEASISLQNRDAGMARVVKDHLERDLELLGVTGVEDKLQHDVKPSLELLRNAGVKIWMLTGDKVETARCVAVSSKLVARGQYVHTIARMKSKDQAESSLNFLRSKPDACLLIDGESLALMLSSYQEAFISTAVSLSAVVACRCSPTQKADVAQLIRSYTKKRTCCIGDGGNDVSMIQAADVGVGIVGKEGRQASLAADFSILQFCYLTKLLMWHGRNSYKRSAKISQFVIHRGLIIAVCQTVWSIAKVFAPDALYRDWLLVGYATVYTMMPVFSLVLDTDIPPQLAHLYPELYHELSTSRSLSYRTFFIWVAISIYQGTAIQLLSQVFVPVEFSDTGPDDIAFKRMVSVSFTVLIINELVMVAAEITTWHWIMVASILGTSAIYFGSVPFLDGYFDLPWILTPAFLWRVVAIGTVSLVPVYAVKLARRKLRPPSYRKVQQGL